MPIRINLLAEAQELEEMRRRDPVKRAIWAGICLVVAMLGWSVCLQLKVMIIQGELSRKEAQVAARKTAYDAVQASQNKLAEMNHHLASLQQLAANRLLYGSLLNALQQAIVDDVQLNRFRTDQSYSLVEELKSQTNANGRVTPGQPARMTERVSMVLEAKDSAANPGDQVNKFKQSISQSPAFAALFGGSNEVRLANLSPPQSMGDAKSFVQFNLECRFSEKTR
jgi:hypothetical protein